MKKTLRKILSIVVIMLTISSNLSFAYAQSTVKPTVNKSIFDENKNPSRIVVSEYRIEIRAFEGEITPGQYINVTVWSEDFNCYMKGTLSLLCYAHYPYYTMITIANYTGYVFAVI